jgi:hypothetical protein
MDIEELTALKLGIDETNALKSTPRSGVEKMRMEPDGALSVVTDDKLALAIRDAQLEPASAQELLNQFAPLMAEARKLANTAKGIDVKAEDDALGMKLARTTRLAFRDVRVRTERLRKTLKEDSLRRGKAIDGVCRVVEYLIVPIEEKLEAMENLAATKAAERAAKLKADREELLRPYSISTEFYSLEAMPEDAFARLLDDTRRAHEAKIQQRIAEQKARDDEIKAIQRKNLAASRKELLLTYGISPTATAMQGEAIADLSDEDFRKMSEDHRFLFEQEQERKRKALEEIRAADERQKRRAIELTRLGSDWDTCMDPASDLRTMSDEAYAKIYGAVKMDFDKRQSEARAIQDGLKKAKAESDKKAADEKLAREKAEKALADRKKADADKALAEQKAKAKAAKAPDKTKLLMFAESLWQMPFPSMATREGNEALDSVRVRVGQLKTEIERIANQL